MDEGRSESDAEVLRALGPLLRADARPHAEQSSAAPPRAPIVPPARMIGAPVPPPAVPLPRILVPDETAPAPQEEHPHRRVERSLYIVAALVLVVSASAFLLSRPTGATQGESRASAPTLTPLAGAEPMGTLEIGGNLPDDAVIVANGRALERRTLVLPAGEYVLGASAAGHVPVVDTLRIAAGRTVVWTPHLAAIATPAPVASPRVARRRDAELDAQRVALERAIAEEAAAIRAATERLRALDASASPPRAADVPVTRVAQDSTRAPD